MNDVGGAILGMVILCSIVFYNGVSSMAVVTLTKTDGGNSLRQNIYISPLEGSRKRRGKCLVATKLIEDQTKPPVMLVPRKLSQSPLRAASI